MVLLIKRYKFQFYIALLLFVLSISIPLAISIGVITFFAAQRELILNKLAQVGIVKKLRQGC